MNRDTMGVRFPDRERKHRQRKDREGRLSRILNVNIINIDPPQSQRWRALEAALSVNAIGLGSMLPEFTSGEVP
jgi:hypothetical protein